MNRLWKNVILPVIKHANANYIIEVGSDTGVNTKNILKYCKEFNAHMVAIDPFPQFDVDGFKRDYGSKFDIYEELSLSVLPVLSDYDVILLDGDHNWYTVYNELKIIEKTFKNKKFPIVFLHDIGWPYGRRDLYYNPENIPDAYRHPYKKLGMVPGQEDLREAGGLNSQLCNSISENNPKNGVLTGVEDFINDSDLEFSLIIINVFFGLGILFPKNTEFENKVNKVVESANLLDVLEEQNNRFITTNTEIKEINTQNKAKIEYLESQLNQKEIQLISANELINKGELQIAEKEFKIQEKKDELNASNELVEQKDREINDLTIKLYEMGYLNNEGRSFIQRLISIFPYLYILFNRKNKGIKNILRNIKGYYAIKKYNLFDIGYYLFNNYDVRVSGMDPILHYIYHGFKEGRKPNSTFDNDYYLKRHKDVKKSKLNPLVHYSLKGMKEGRKINGNIKPNRNFSLNNPKVTIVTASYNYAYLIEKAIKSVIDQTYKNWELIIVDDGSTDNSMEITRKYTSNPKIKLYQHEEGINKGLKETLLLGIKHSTGEYIVFLEADDWLENNYLKEKIEVLKHYPQIKFIFNDVDMFPDHDEFDLTWYNDYLNSQRTILRNKNEPFNCAKYFNKHNFIPTFSCVMVEKDILLTCDFNTPSDPALDYWIFKQLANKTDFYYVDKKLTHWMMHKNSYINKIFTPHGDFKGFESEDVRLSS